MHDEILRRCKSRHITRAGEYGSVTKERHPGLLRYAFCFPDTYDIGMSYLGGKILYGLLNSIEGRLVRAGLCAGGRYGGRNAGGKPPAFCA